MILGVPSALPLAILAGLLEIVPTIGPVIAAVPAVLVGFTVSPVIGIAVASLYFLVQQLENHLIVPKIMQKAVGVNPLVTILSLGVGFQLGGPIGAILAVPILIVLLLIASELLGLSAAKRIE
jgi:predicted PurR-regulated permease PerM